MNKSWLSRFGVLSFAPAGALVLAVYIHQLDSGDLGLHLRAGQWISNHLTVPRVDVFSYTATGRPWIDFEWLYQVLAFASYRWGGASGLTLIHALAAVAALWLMGWACKPQTPYLARSLALLLPAFSQILYPWIRPQVFTLFFLGLYTVLLRRTDRLSGRRMAGILVLQALWVNIHGGYVLGLLVLAAHGLAGWWTERKSPVLPAHRAWPRAVLLLGLAAGMSLLNPYGLDLLRHGMTETSSEYARHYLSEWKSPLALFWYPDLPALVIMAGLIFVSTVTRPDAPDRFAVLVVVPFLLLAAGSLRFIPVFALMAVPLLAENIAARGPPAAVRRRLIGGLAAWALPLAGAWLMASGKLYALIGWNFHAGIGPDARRLPVQSAAFISRHQLSGPIYNVYEDGGYLIWHWYPQYPVFQDSRNALYGDDLMFSFQKARRDPRRFYELASTYRFRTALIPYWTAEHQEVVRALLRDPEWALVHVDAYACVFIRAGDRAAGGPPPIQLSEAAPPRNFLFPRPDRIPGKSRLGSLLRDPLTRDWPEAMSYQHLYTLGENPRMSAYWLVRFLMEAPPYVAGYAERLHYYRKIYPTLPAWLKEP